MLLELKVSHFAIIENLHIQFKTGLNILSGETGAGKSVLLKSLGLLMGHKGSSEGIRTGHDQASIEGFFDISNRKDIKNKLDSLGIDFNDDLLIVRRLISQNDKSRIYINGSLSTLATLKEIVSPLIEVTGGSAPLIEMTGQHENRNLLSKEYHLDLLDQYASTWDLRDKYEQLFASLNQIKEQISHLESEARTKEQRLDFLKFQSEEIKDLDLKSGEDLELENEVKKLKSSHKITDFIDLTENSLYNDDDSVASRLQYILQRARELEAIDPQLTNKLESLKQAKTLIDDCVFDLRKYVKQYGNGTQNLDKMQERLSQLRKLQKKYGPTVDDILSAFQKFESEIKLLENSDAEIAQLKKKEQEITLNLKTLAEDLHAKRSKAAKKLTDLVNEELLDLNMKGVTFSAENNKLSALTSTGISDVEFMTQNSAKDPKRPLGKAASGGELSRILLSLKCVIGSHKQPRTYLFDEVDTGVSGPTAEKVGKKLRSISVGQQVICVTHLPQVAACGDHHFYIQKSPQKGSVAMEVNELSSSKRVNEIARLISGEKISKTSLAHAQELLKQVH